MRTPNLAAIFLLMATVASICPASAEQWRLTLNPAASEAHFGLETTLHRVEGTLYLQTGEILFDLDSGAASGEVTLDATRTETGNQARDKKMHRAVLESALYPTITFHPLSISGRLGPDKRGALTLEGRVTIHGETHPLRLEADVMIDGGQATGEAVFEIPYAEWGMRNPSLLMIRVAKEVQVELRAVGRLDPASATAASVSH